MFYVSEIADGAHTLCGARLHSRCLAGSPKIRDPKLESGIETYFV